MWMGGFAPLGYLPRDRTLVIDESQAERVRAMYRMYLELGVSGG
jgi:site-specific DNA recombinase